MRWDRGGEERRGGGERGVLAHKRVSLLYTVLYSIYCTYDVRSIILHQK